MAFLVIPAEEYYSTAAIYLPLDHIFSVTIRETPGRGWSVEVEAARDKGAFVYRPAPYMERDDAEIAVNGARYGTVFGRDFAGRNLPYSTGCYTVKSGYVVPLNNHIARSFDGRYFGQVPDSYIVGKVRTLWTY